MRPTHLTRLSFPIPDDLCLLVEGSNGFVDSVARQLDPYVAGPMDGSAALLTISETSDGRRAIRELQNLAGDGWVTAHDGERLLIVANGRTCSLPDGRGIISVEPGFPTRRLMSVVRPALQLALLERGIPVLHAASVEIDGRGILVAGWSESGKTETALALVELGASFISDKWTLLLPGARAGAFPIGVGVRRWVLGYLPQLRSSLPGGARSQLRAAALATAVTAPIRNRSWGGAPGLVVELARRAVELGDRAALTPREVRAAYGDTRNATRTVPIGLVVVLRNSPSSEVTIEAGDPTRLATRLAVSAATEREAFLALRRRAAYAEARPTTVDDLIARDAASIEPVFAHLPLVEVTAPFPTDPREVARQIAGRL